jgi:beta-carotene ketolase (CrtW type)
MQSQRRNMDNQTYSPYTGIWVGFAVIALWFISLSYLLSVDLTTISPWIYIGILVQTHLYTGLFITAHDAMHGSVFPNNMKLNHIIGRLCTTLFMFNSYNILKPKHYLHHRFAGTDQDPDYHNGSPNFFRWYFDFLKEYVSIKQIILAAITFNLLKLVLPQTNLIVFWILPSFLSTLQLFYFGTYVPHMGEHSEDNQHNSSTLSKNHLWAFLSCYFFGYHFEHHDSPTTPWWRLWKVKEGQTS